MQGEDIITISHRGLVTVTKAEGDDIVKLLDRDSNTKASYVYGKNGSFRQDVRMETDVDKLRNVTEEQRLIFQGKENIGKANKFFEFASRSNSEFGLIEIEYNNPSCYETVLITEFSHWKVNGPSYVADILDKNLDAVIKRMRHSHPGGFDKRSMNPAAPSGFNTLSLEPNAFSKGDRTNYIEMKKNYGNRVPEYFEQYYSDGINIYNTLYNGKNAIRKPQ